VIACADDISLSHLCWVCNGASQHTQSIASAAWVIYHSGELVSSGGIFLRSTTNNMAEYHVVIRLLTEASSLGITHLIINLDSQLMVCQLNRDYIVHNPVLLCLHLRVRHLERSFEFLQYIHTERTQYNIRFVS
jgi:ribonuclease HI